MRVVVRPIVVVLVSLLLALGCSESNSPKKAASASPAAAATQTTTAIPAAAPEHRGRPLPAFQGTTVDGKALDLSSLVGNRLLLFFFNPAVPEASGLAKAVMQIAPAQQTDNFRIIGISMGESLEATRIFMKKHGLEMTVVQDQDGVLSTRIGLRSPLALIVVDADGYMVAGSDAFPTGESNEQLEGPVVALLRQWLRLPNPEDMAVAMGERPEAPLFSAPEMRSNKTFRLASLRGKPVVLIFFLHTCPHCHHALETLKAELAKIPADHRPVLVGISVVDEPMAVQDRLQHDGLDFFKVLFDPDSSIRRAYGAVAGVPAIFLIDRSGHILWRVDGWRDDRDPPLMRMRLAKLAGEPVPMMLSADGYSGNEFCTVCHQEEGLTWELTNHAHAFDNLVRHNADQKPDCVNCHVVGYGKPGGYDMDRPQPALENVGCEDCHGRGGPHLSPHFVENHDYSKVCVTCHDPKHSIGFEYATFVKRISHKANQQFAHLSLAQKKKLLESRELPRKHLLPTKVAYVGSQACKSCHPKEYATWSHQPHAHALQTLQAKGEAKNADCLGCHTTGFGLEGGFPKSGTPSHAGLAAVGCESCHGPGGNHVKPGAPKRGTILSLGDKCDTCAILQICGTCHDQKNDPGFQFEVVKKIEEQRHGTIKASGGPPPPQAALHGTALVGLLDRAFRSAGTGS